MTVFILRALTRLLRDRENPTPHQTGGPDAAEYAALEYSRTHNQLDFLLEHAGTDFFDHRDVLEFGCGFGGNVAYYTSHTNARSVVGLDLHPQLIEAFDVFSRRIGADLSRCRVVRGDGKAVPIEDGSFDSIFSVDVIEHVHDLPIYLAETERLLRPGGRVLFAFPSILSLFWHHLDALPWPGIHLVFGYPRLIAGLNYEKLRRPDRNPFPLIGRTRDTTFRKDMHPEMSGVSAAQFHDLFDRTGLEIVKKDTLPVRFNRFAARNRLIAMLWRFPALREPLSSYVVVLARKPRANGPKSPVGSS